MPTHFSPRAGPTDHDVDAALRALAPLRRVMTDSRLSHGQRRLMQYLWLAADAKPGTLPVGVRDAAAAIGADPGTISRWLDRLDTLGLLHVYDDRDGTKHVDLYDPRQAVSGRLVKPDPQRHFAQVEAEDDSPDQPPDTLPGPGVAPCRQSATGVAPCRQGATPQPASTQYIPARASDLRSDTDTDSAKSKSPEKPNPIGSDSELGGDVRGEGSARKQGLQEGRRRLNRTTAWQALQADDFGGDGGRHPPDPRKLEACYRAAVEVGFLRDSYDDRLQFYASAYHCTMTAKSPVRALVHRVVAGTLDWHDPDARNTRWAKKLLAGPTEAPGQAGRGGDTHAIGDVMRGITDQLTGEET